ncbi:ankyrin repeat domain-containing protein [Mycolicibacterium rufum]|uniref:Ankyrin repeat domain-containing protein n=1 Tax=Mycolicibacterium rufum TaxID=318424 RepID=A0A9X2YCG7_9MYCO|nr:ankyrin repeat domain-containing protein [Mycolicibacterium rufum]KGI68559.1 ankyrin [Mycolicibacterium rufum]MCV7071253.1 ankyrin repeat domain-containing protein [Mycolicibacterium rufum]ULP34695.1 ankyrin repeat domain-containing protein [Mycolicibacterium rufum]
MASMLPDNPSLSRLREQARSLQRRARAGDPDAVESIQRHHPRPDRVLAQLPDRFALHDAQVTVARRYGFTGWPALVRYLDTAATLTVDPSRVDEGALGEADRFCALAVLHYTDVDAPPRWKNAVELLTATPDLTEDHVWAAAAAADAGTLRRLLRVDRTQAVAAGGPFGWPPLLYLCYSRATASRAETLETAALLLDAGADPNAGYLWRGMSTPFTALTGVFGEGEQGPRRQPRHPFCTELATLLLDRGAHPADHQTLYNRMFRPDDSHLELLFDRGVADGGPSPWERRLGEAMETRAQMWRRQVQWAAAHGFSGRLELLERHGIDVGGVEVVAPTFPADPNARDEDGATALHHAAWAGDLDLIARLLAAGADRDAVDDRFGTTPQQWAEHADQSEAAALLRERPPR